MTKKKITEQRHYYTADKVSYSSKEISENCLEGNWVPYNEYIRVVKKLDLLKSIKK